MTEQYACQSYDDNGIIKDCTCGKCSSPNSHLMKIQFVIISDSGDQTYSSIAENFTDAKDAAIFVQETIESNPNLTHCSGCEVLVEGKTGDTVYCKKCRKFIPDDSDFSSAVDEV